MEYYKDGNGNQQVHWMSMVTINVQKNGQTYEVETIGHVDKLDT